MFKKAYQFYKEKKKQRIMRQFYSRFISSGDLCFDIGANIGKYAKILLYLNAKVVAVEPQPVCVRELSLIKNSNLTIIASAISDTVGETTLFVCNMNEVSTLSEEFIQHYKKYDYLSWETSIITPLTTLNELILKFGTPHYCKIDVEGFELNVIKGLHHAIPMISFEFTPAFRKNTLACIDILQQLGTYTFNYYPYETMQFVLPQAVSANEMKTILVNMDTNILTGDIYAFLQSDDRI